MQNSRLLSTVITLALMLSLVVGFFVLYSLEENKEPSQESIDRLLQKTLDKPRVTLEVDEIVPVQIHDLEPESEPGEIIDTEGYSLPTRNPSWGILEFDLKDKVVALMLDFEFTTPESAEGIFSVYWDEELVRSFDQRLVQSVEGWFIHIPEELSKPGVHTLSVRLDGYGEEQAKISIENMQIIGNSYIHQLSDIDMSTG